MRSKSSHLISLGSDLISPLTENRLGHSSFSHVSYKNPFYNDDFVKITLGPNEMPLPHIFQLQLAIDGRSIAMAQTEIGFLHQGLEKQLEITPYTEIPQLLARLSPHYALPYHWGLFLLLQQILKKPEPPLLLRAWQTVGLELTRAAYFSELLIEIMSLCSSPHLHNTMKLFHQHIHNLYELLSAELLPLQLKEIFPFLKDSLKPVHHYLHLHFQEWQKNPEAQKHLRNLGGITKSQAISHAISGPVLRATGTCSDQRYKKHYALYEHCQVKPTAQGNGDGWSRYLIYLEEISLSLNLITQAVEAAQQHLQQESEIRPYFNSIWEADYSLIETQQHYLRIEGLQGDLQFFLHHQKGQNTPYRFHIRSGSFFIVSALPLVLQNTDVEDLVLLLHTLGINMLEVDR